MGYARVSTSAQKLDMQLDALKAVACDDVYSDHGVSGAKATRPGLDAMLEALRPGDVVVVFKLCRLGRSVAHLADLLKQFEQDGIHFCSISEGINTATSGGRLVYHVFSAVAEFHRDLIRENTLHGIEAARHRGKQLGRPRKLSDYDVADAYVSILEEGLALDTVAQTLGVSSLTLKRAFQRSELEAV